MRRIFAYYCRQSPDPATLGSRRYKEGRESMKRLLAVSLIGAELLTHSPTNVMAQMSEATKHIIWLSCANKVDGRDVNHIFAIDLKQQKPPRYPVWVVVGVHPFVRRERPSLRPDLGSGGPARAAAVKGGRRPPPRSGGLPLTAESTLASSDQSGRSRRGGNARHGPFAIGVGAGAALVGEAQRLRSAEATAGHPH